MTNGDLKSLHHCTLPTKKYRRVLDTTHLFQYLILSVLNFSHYSMYCHGCKMSREDTLTCLLKGSCSQNTLKNKRLDHQSYRNLIDKERLSRDAEWDLKTRCPLSTRVGWYMYL
jgi:hypothetical protein